jgi:D-alanine-D-alanine ligase
MKINRVNGELIIGGNCIVPFGKEVITTNRLRIGIVLETKEDAEKAGMDLSLLYHWREPVEIEAITETLQSMGFEVTLLGSPAVVCQNLTVIREQVDFIINLSVGFRSRFRLSLGPALYQLGGIPYWGADPYTKMVSQNKHLMKSFLDKMGIPTPEWIYLHDLQDLIRIDLSGCPGFPLMVKPAFEGSSIGIGGDALVTNEKQLRDRVKQLFNEVGLPVIVERFIAGRELKVGFVGNERLEFIGVIEDVKDDGTALGKEFLFYDAKTRGTYAKIRCDLNEPEIKVVIDDCLRIHRKFLPMDYGTFDLRLDEAGRHYFLEFNADATLHPRRTLARCAELNGVNYHELIRRILAVSFERWGITWN